jgi:carboxylesterase
LLAKSNIHNPHLPGDAFFWEAGETGLLLIHGFTATTAEVRPLAERLHKQGFTISAPLLPGHYTQPENLNQVKWHDWADEVERAYLELAKEHQPVMVGGESTGALLSLYLGIKYPEIHALLLYAPALRLTLTPFNKLKLFLFAPLISSIPKANLDDNPYWQGYPVNPLKGTLQLLRLQAYLTPRLKQVHQPLLIVQGRKDPTVHPETPDFIYQRVESKFKEKHWMEASAHCVIIDQEMEQVMQITLDFIQKISPKKASKFHKPERHQEA